MEAYKPNAEEKKVIAVVVTAGEAPVLETLSSSTDFEDLVDAVIRIAEECAKNKKEKDEFRTREKTFSQYFRENLDLIVELRSKFPPPGSSKKIEIKGKMMNWSAFCDEYFGVSTQWVAEQVRGVKYRAAEDEELTPEVPEDATTGDLEWDREIAKEFEESEKAFLARQAEIAHQQETETQPKSERVIPEEVKEFWSELPEDKTKGFGRFANYRVHTVGGKLDCCPRGSGMAMDRLRNLASEMQIPARIQFEDHGFTLKIIHLSEKGAREILKFIGQDK